MNAQAYWDRLCRANPPLETTGRFQISIESFRCEVLKAFAAGAKSMDDRTTKPVGELASPFSYFNNLFRGFFRNPA